MKKNLEKNIVLIGAGKTAHSLVANLSNINFKPNLIISKNILSAKNLAEKFSIKNYSDDFSKIADKNLIVFISTPDREIKNVALRLAKEKINFASSYFIHLSGAKNIDELKSLKLKNANCGTIHFMQTFPSKEVVNLNETLCVIEFSNSKVEKFLKSLANKMKLKVFTTESEIKIFYHLAGVFTSNFLVSNFYAAEKLLRKSGIKNISHLELMKNIIETTLTNINKKGILNSLSGPIERGDVDTVRKHIVALKKEKKLSNLYKLNSLNLLDLLAEKNKALTKEQKIIKEILIK